MKKTFLVAVFLALPVFGFINCSGFRSFKDFSSSSFGDPSSLIPSLFKIERKTVMILPYAVRINKLKSIIGSTDSALYAQLESQKMSLGHYDFSKGIAPDVTWTDARLTAWTLGLQPYCSSPALVQKYPFPQNAGNFILAAYGRKLSADDQSVVDSIQTLSTTAVQKLELFCYVVLSSLEFVAQ